MLKVYPRNGIYQMEWIIRGQPRLRATLETKSHRVADTIRQRLKFAAAEGPKSQLWFELSRNLPPVRSTTLLGVSV
jgi:hypothetical protein